VKIPFRTKALTSMAALSLALSLAGCAPAQEAGSAASSAAASQNTTSTAQAATQASEEASGELAADTHYDADDLTWDQAEETSVALADGATMASGENAQGVKVDGDTVTITSGGTYRLSGVLSKGRLVVATTKDDVVRIVLDGVSLSSDSGSAVEVEEANEVLLYLEEGTDNTVSDASTYADTSQDAANAAIYSMADLTIAGSGALEVKGNYQDGIVSKDGLVLASGNVTVDAADDGIKGKDYTVVLDGSYQITATGDGIKSTNDTDEGRGWLLLNGGDLKVSAGDDAIKAQTTLTVNGGTTTVSKSTEGLEAASIIMNGGTVNITSSDDGVNAAGASSTEQGGGMGGEAAGDYHIQISGGEMTVNAEGDGLDSNGDISITGGTILVNGPTGNGNGAIDANGDITVNGGTLAAAGSAGMAQGLSEGSEQSGVQVSFETAVPAGTPIHIVDSSGQVVASFVTTKETASLVYSGEGIQDGQQYKIYTGGTADVAAGVGAGNIEGATQATTVTAGEYSSGGMGGGMGGPGGGPGGR